MPPVSWRGTPLDDLLLTAVVLVCVLGVALLSVFFLPLRRAKVELGLTPAYEERCTARRSLGFGFFGTYSSLRISFYDNFVVLASVLRRVISYDSVKLVEYKVLFVSKGVVIHTRNPNASYALFPSQPQKMLELFAGKGVPVAGR
jgi:hypothetical protein